MGPAAFVSSHWDEPDGRAWMIVWGPRFLGKRSLRIWLPDGSALDLRLPLPEAVEVLALGTIWESPGRDARPGVATARGGA